MGQFRPSARVRLQLRFDEGSDTGPLEGKLEKDPPDEASFQDTLAGGAGSVTDQLNTVNGSIRDLSRSRESFDVGEHIRQLNRLRNQRDKIQLQLGNPQGQIPPEGLSASSPDDRVILGNIIPMSCSITRNGIRSPDEFTVALDYADAPIDPRVVRSCGIVINLGVVESGDFTKGMRGQQRDDGSLLSLVEGATPEQVFRSSTQFVGYVDEWQVMHNAEGGSELVMSGRDITSVLSDNPLPAGESIDLTKPIEEGVSELIDSFSTSRGIKVFFGSPGQAEPTGLLFGEAGKGPIPADVTPPSKKARRGKLAKRVRAGDKRMSVWDHINDVCGAIGLVPIFRGFELYLMEPRTYFASDPGKRTMLYGRNLTDLNFTRKLGGTKVPTIEVRAYDPEIGRTRWARAPSRAGERNSGILGQTDPPKAVRASEVSPQGATEDRIRTFSVRGINDGKQLEIVAESIFQQLGRQEIEGSFETDDIDSFEREGEADLLALLSGDPIELLIARPAAAEPAGPGKPPGSPTTTTVQTLQEMSVARRADFLVGIGYQREVAQTIAEAQESEAFNTTFRVQDVVIDYSAEDGIHISGDFVNFIVVRELDDSASKKAGIGELTEALTKASNTLAADDLRGAASGQRGLTQDRADGNITNDEYVSGSRRSGSDRRRAARDFKGSR